MKGYLALWNFFKLKIINFSNDFFYMKILLTKKFYNMKHLSNCLNFGIIVLTNLFLFISAVNAKDLIEVVLDDNLDFATNNYNIPATAIYNDFSMSVNFTQINIFEPASNEEFPVNIDGFFEEGSSHVKLQLNQSSFASLKQSKPQNLLVEIPVASGKKFTLALKKGNPISDDFQFKNVDGNAIAFNEGIHYQGIIKDHATSWAAISIFEDYVRALFIDYEGIYVLSAINHFDDHYLLYNDKKLAVPYYSNLSCGVDELEVFGEHGMAKQATGSSRSSKKLQDRPLRISIETDYAMFEHQQNFQHVYNYVTATLNEAAMFFRNESIDIELSEIVAWDTEDTYDKNSASTALQEFGERRRDAFNGDLLHLFTSEYRDIGGIANVDALGQCYLFYPQYDINYGPYGLSVVDFWPCAFGLYHYDVWTFVHEIGHNLGSRHTHFPVWEVNDMPNQTLDNAEVCHDPAINCFDHETTLQALQKTGGSIMSYYVATEYGASFYRGYGTQPGNLIRDNINEFFDLGCMDVLACNYNPNASVEDGSCIFGNRTNNTFIFEEIPWLNGQINKINCSNESIIVYTNPGENFKNVLINNDGCITNYNCSGDIAYGIVPDFNTINIVSSWTCKDCNGNRKGCTDPNACNYNATANFNDGTCNYGNTTCTDNCNTNCTCLNISTTANTSNDIFAQYPWLANAIGYNGLCNFEKITEYDFSTHQFINIEFNDGTAQLYRGDGTFYCTTNLCYDCFDQHIPNPNLATITCWTCPENCDALGVVTYQICDGGQWYYTIETTDGETIDPYNDLYNINFSYPNGAVVNFSYVEEFPSNCEYVEKGVQINCIEEVEFPCNFSHTGTVFYETCDDGLEYYLIEMDNGQILDPYNSSTVNFNFVDGDIVEFEYLPYNQTYCNLSDVAGMILCIRSIGCNNTGIVFAENCNNSNYLIRATDGSIIYPYDLSGSGYVFQNGDIVKFDYSSTFASPCSEATYGVYLTCIEKIELPCTHTGTVINEFCDGTNYKLIDMGDAGILDPYLSPIVNFEFEEGATVEFAYLPIPFSPCVAAGESGILTCVQNVCRNNIRTINSVPIPDGMHGNAKHIITWGEVHQSSNVTLRANRITMPVGFKVEAGARFKTISDGCQ